ncbi:MAG: hypothetical protein HRU23_04160 [Gammaproteobacteria bacterium]|nr:hypothetical protein [Gammaproteobacteria bacterium]
MKIIILFILLFILQPQAYGQAYCSLRDPVAQIRELYPQKTNQLSIVKTVDAHTRNQVKLALPSNDLHFSELGRHTLYVVMKNSQALGYIHVRSEQSKWGLVEIIWAMDKDLKIKGFACQRCRSPNRKMIENERFKNVFIGKNFQDLKTLLSHDGVTANKVLLDKAKDAPELANVVLRSALKTLLITDILWGEELKRFNQ